MAAKAKVSYKVHGYYEDMEVKGYPINLPVPGAFAVRFEKSIPEWVVDDLGSGFAVARTSSGTREDVIKLAREVAMRRGPSGFSEARSRAAKIRIGENRPALANEVEIQEPLPR